MSDADIIVIGSGHNGLVAAAYLAVAGGGVLTPPVLGSRATHVVSRMGGLGGRALAAGDEVPIARAATGRSKRARAKSRRPTTSTSRYAC